jgi:3-oxoadipate enol-lactonase
MPYFETSDGCRLFYDYQQSDSPKPVVVFLNGLTQTAVNWKAISNHLKENFQVLAYDARAQGRSDPGSSPLSLELHSSDLQELLGYLKIEITHLVGVSHGAVVALEFASRFPANVDRLMLCSVSARPTSRLRLVVKSWLEILERQGLEAMAWATLPVVFGEDFLRHHQTGLEKLVKAIVVRNGRDAVRAQLQASMGYPPLLRIATTMRNPVLVLSGSDDPLVTAIGAHELAELCKGRFRLIPGAGHSLPAEAPELFIEILREFLVHQDA